MVGIEFSSARKPVNPTTRCKIDWEHSGIFFFFLDSSLPLGGNNLANFIVSSDLGHTSMTELPRLFRDPVLYPRS